MGNPRLDIVGKRFGMLTVIDYAGKDSGNNTLWLCECDCGNQTVVRGTAIKHGRTKSCGCLNEREDLAEQRFGRLTVLEYIGTNKRRESLWLCECDCGNQAIIPKTALKTSHTKSCGCLHKDVVGERSTKHSLSGHPLYNNWDSMHQRCINKNNIRYSRYGGRGITVCDEWKDFKNFYDWSIDNGYEPGLSIDRIDNDGNYEPGNCRWADTITQANNKSTCRYITYNGVKHTLMEWSRLFNVPYTTLCKRIKHNNMQDFESYFSNLGTEAY